MNKFTKLKRTGASGQRYTVLIRHHENDKYNVRVYKEGKCTWFPWNIEVFSRFATFTSSVRDLNKMIGEVVNEVDIPQQMRIKLEELKEEQE